MLAYIETSAVDAAVRRQLSPENLRSALRRLGYEPVSGHMTLHEIARPLATGKRDITEPQARFLLDLEPSWHLPAPVLIEKEIAFLRAHEPISPVLDDANANLTIRELTALAGGHVSSELREMVLKRMVDKREHWAATTGKYLDGISTLRKTDRNSAPRFRTFAETKAFFQTGLPRFVQGATYGAISISEARTLARQLPAFPAIEAHVNYWLYLAFICLSSGVRPAHDRLDDFRHAIEATYCHALLTNDDGLLRAMPSLVSNIRALSWQDVLAAA